MDTELEVVTLQVVRGRRSYEVRLSPEKAAAEKRRLERNGWTVTAHTSRPQLAHGAWSEGPWPADE